MTKIIYIDDDEVTRFLVRKSLELKGYTVWEAANGKEGLLILLRNLAIQCVLLDLKMPVMSGFEATKQIKAFRPGLPVIAITAFALSGDENRAFEAGCDDYIAKPFEREVLLIKLKKLQ